MQFRRIGIVMASLALALVGAASVVAGGTAAETDVYATVDNLNEAVEIAEGLEITDEDMTVLFSAACSTTRRVERNREYLPNTHPALAAEGDGIYDTEMNAYLPEQEIIELERDVLIEVGVNDQGRHFFEAQWSTVRNELRERGVHLASALNFGLRQVKDEGVQKASYVLCRAELGAYKDLGSEERKEMATALARIVVGGVLIGADILVAPPVVKKVSVGLGGRILVRGLEGMLF